MVARAEFLEPINICCRLLQPLRGSDNQQQPTPVSREAYPREEAGPRIARGGYRWVPASDCFAPVKPKSRRQFLAVRQTVPVGPDMAGRTGVSGKPASRRRTPDCKASRDPATCPDDRRVRKERVSTGR